MLLCFFSIFLFLRSPLHDELGLVIVFETRDGQKHVFDEADEAVPLDFLGGRMRLLQFPRHHVRGVQDIDLAVRLAAAHLPAREPGDHGVHEVGALAVADLREGLCREREDLALVDAAELGVDAEVFLVEGLHQRVEQAGEGGVVDLLDDFGAGFLGVVLGDDGGEAEEVHAVGGGELVGGAEDEFEGGGRDGERVQEGGDHVAVVGGAVGDELEGGFEVVEEAVDVGEEDLYGAAGAQEVGDFEDGDEVAAVGAAGCGCSCGWRGMVSWRGSRTRRFEE